ncbi:MAG: Maf family protein [Planctomycetaceae bacterium]
MPGTGNKLILGSRSPRRLELLSLLIPREQIEVRAPLESTEAGFDDLQTEVEIEQRLAEIARTKNADVAAQPGCAGRAILTADTVIVARDAAGNPVVLGQPPEDATWPDVVREWFREYYFGRTHAALTAVCLRLPDSSIVERIVKSEVTFGSDGERWLDWYIATEEPRGKAGGYGLQGAADVFVERIVKSEYRGLRARALGELLAKAKLRH